MSRLKNEAREEGLAKVPAWTLVEGRDAIERTFVFEDFVDAFAFMTAVAPVAERMNHHPEWFNVYNTVKVTLSTHDVGGLSPLDIELAQVMDGLAAR
jgi:4a-hydroxytetrahydrobiopterin dehydratase